MMLAKLVQGFIDPHRMDVAGRAVDAELIPRFGAHPGARSGYWMANRRTGQVLIMTTWSDGDSLGAAQSADGAERARVAERIGLSIRAIQTLDVVAAHQGDTTGTPVLRWVRATWVDGVPPELAAGLPAAYRGVVPDQARSSGFRGSYWLADGATGHGLALSFWDGAEQLIASERGSRGRRRRLGQALGFRIGLISHYEALGVALQPVVAGAWAR